MTSPAWFDRLLTASLITIVTAGAAHAQPLTPRDSAEASVWRFIVARTGAKPPIVSRAPGTYSIVCGLFHGRRCDPDSLDTAFRPAMRDLLIRSRDSTAVPDAWFALAGLASQDTTQTGGRCDGRAVMSITHVGFDASLSRAAVSYIMIAGAGPFPSCGFAAGATYLLERADDGTWRVVRSLDGWIT